MEKKSLTRLVTFAINNNQNKGQKMRKRIYNEKQLLGTSSSLEMAIELMESFYGGSKVTLKETACPNYYDVVTKEGKILDGVFVWKKGNRFRFSIKE